MVSLCIVSVADSIFGKRRDFREALFGVMAKQIYDDVRDISEDSQASLTV